MIKFIHPIAIIWVSGDIECQSQLASPCLFKSMVFLFNIHLFFQGTGIEYLIHLANKNIKQINAVVPFHYLTAETRTKYPEDAEESLVALKCLSHR